MIQVVLFCIFTHWTCFYLELSGSVCVATSCVMSSSIAPKLVQSALSSIPPTGTMDCCGLFTFSFFVVEIISSNIHGVLFGTAV